MQALLRALGREGEDAASELLQSLLDASADCLRVLDLQGRIQFMNRAGLREIQVADLSDIQGDLWRDKWPEETRPVIDAALAAARAGGTQSFRAPALSHLGKSILWDTTVSPMRDAAGEVRWILAVSHDVTAPARALAALRRTLKEAEAVSAAKTAFLANMSHEIRTPMNGIVAGADMLSRRPLDPASQELVEIIRTSSRTLEALMTDVLDAARIESGQVAIVAEPFHLGDLVRSAAALARLRADEKGVALRIVVTPEAEAWVAGDAGRIRQVLMNLLSNAVKFTERGRVEISAERLADGRFRLRVADTGIGFDPDFKTRLFGRFQQADGSIGRRFGGSGLGMAISWDLVRLMGGTLDAEGRPGEGATFWFDLPLPPAKAPAPEPAELQAIPPRQDLKILLADDHPTNRKVLELMLSDVAEVVPAENGLEALEAYKRGGVDLALMDMQMPVMDGVEAVRAMREHERATGAPRVPVVMLTANALPEHVAASLEAGADRHLQKPVTMPSLIKIILDLAPRRPTPLIPAKAGTQAGEPPPPA